MLVRRPLLGAAGAAGDGAWVRGRRLGLAGTRGGRMGPQPATRGVRGDGRRGGSRGDGNHGGGGGGDGHDDIYMICVVHGR
jgi:hypothetical protein